MRKINVKEIKNAASRLSIEANINLREDIRKAIKSALTKETDKRARRILEIILENAYIARDEKIAMCQDTGLVVVDIELGQDVSLVGGDLTKAINDGIKSGYAKGSFRKSAVMDPVSRKGASAYVPAVIYTEIVKGSKVKITVSPKGFGSENKSKIKMFNPTDGKKEIEAFVLDTVKAAGPDACPPYIIGIGIGGTFDKAAVLSKKALFRPVNKHNPKPEIKKMEEDIFNAVNKSGTGPMGLGGKTTCLGVSILDAPTHIAGLPVAVNVSCHATRSKTVII
jgi:fumarate hydratase subunit alpha